MQICYLPFSSRGNVANRSDPEEIERGEWIGLAEHFETATPALKYNICFVLFLFFMPGS